VGKTKGEVHNISFMLLLHNLVVVYFYCHELFY